MTDRSATPATIAAVLPLLKPGDTLFLTGAFPDLRPRAGALSGVTIDAREATLGVLYPGKTVDLSILGGAWAGLRFDGIQRLSVSGARLEGPEAQDGYGLFVNGGADVIVSGCAFFSYRTGLVLNRVASFRVEDSGFARMRSDGITIGESREGVVRRNVFHGTRITGEEHPDAVQLYSRPTSAPTADITIENNVVVGETQGFCGFNHVRAGVNDGGFDRIRIRNNKVVGGYPHGIALVEARHSEVTDNHVETYPTSKYRASINLTACTDMIRSGNVVLAGAGKPGVTDE